jgi:hypothetical protein
MDNTVAFLNKIKPLAEDKGITSAWNAQQQGGSQDYQCDRTWWGVEV